jgi:preprotein translocase subunit YajC
MESCQRQGDLHESQTSMVRVAGLFVQGIGGSAPILMMVAIFAIFYFLLIMPQQRRQKKWQAMLSQVKPGDKVVTSGGLTGAIMSVKDDVVVLRIPPDNIKMEVTRASIVTLTEDRPKS